jgi:hypothetical protein
VRGAVSNGRPYRDWTGMVSLSITQLLLRHTQKHFLKKQPQKTTSKNNLKKQPQKTTSKNNLKKQPSPSRLTPFLRETRYRRRLLPVRSKVGRLAEDRRRIGAKADV